MTNDRSPHFPNSPAFPNPIIPTLQHYNIPIAEQSCDAFPGRGRNASYPYDNKIQVILSFFQSCHAVQYSTKSLKRNIQHPWLSQ
jgi:hypothetical protein